MLKHPPFYAHSALLLGVLLLTMSPAVMSQPVSGTPLVGNWQGTLNAMGSKLRVVFHVAKTDSNTLEATLDSPDQGAIGIPVSSVNIKDDSVMLDVAQIGGSYEAVLSADRSSMDGKWRQGGMAFDLTMNKTSEKVAVNRPQEPKPPFPYRSEDVTYENTAEGVRLAGTLTLPDSGGPFPAAIMITGSGPQNRDEELFGHKVFLVIADYLTRRGIAVLRVDDRGVGGSTGGNWSNSTTADNATDVMAGIEFLKARADIDRGKIGLIGHSEGGIIAPMVAAKTKDVAFVVMLAGTGYSGAQIIVEQTRLLEEATGASPEKVAEDVDHLTGIISIAESGKDSSETDRALRHYLASTYSQWGADLKNAGADSARVIEAQVRTFNSPWFRFFLAYDPLPTLRKVKCPVLAMDGSLDLQVPAEENLQAIGDALKAGGNTDYTTKLMPGLNHVFQHAKTGGENEYSQIEETFAPEALKLMGDWITERVKK
jgi:uncharacterized protein